LKKRRIKHNKRRLSNCQKLRRMVSAERFSVLYAGS